MDVSVPQWLANDDNSYQTEFVDRLFVANPEGYKIVDEEGRGLRQIADQYWNYSEEYKLLSIDMTNSIIHPPTETPTLSHGKHSFKMVATSDYSRHQIILKEPFLMESPSELGAYGKIDLISIMMFQLAARPTLFKAMCLLSPYRHTMMNDSLKSNIPRSQLLGMTMHCNNFRRDAGGFFLYFAISFINHSCNPNCIINVAEASNKDAQLIATRDIKAGEELTISYTFQDVSLTGMTQAQALKDKYQIDCRCAQCLESSNPKLKKCAYCNKGGILQLCSRCKVVRYCSRDCQLKDWKNGHKNQCH